MKRFLLAVLAGLAAATLPAGAVEPAPKGPETVVNLQTRGYQFAPSVASLGPTGMVAVWWEDGEAPGGIKGRFLDTAGVPAGGEFWVERGAPFFFDPAVAGSFNGGFVVVWGTQNQILGRHYKDRGSQGTLFQISLPGSTASRIGPHVAMDAAGNFVVVWYESTGLNLFRVLARRYDAAGQPLGDPVRVEQEQISNPSAGGNASPRVALQDDGSFLVAWDSGAGVRIRRFDGPAGTWSAEAGLGFGALAVPVLRPEGDGAVVWVDNLFDVQVRRVDAAGVPQGAAFKIGDYFDFTSFYPSNPAVALDKSGRALVLWTGLETPQELDQTVIQGRLFDRSWRPLGDAFHAAPGSFTQSNPDVVESPSGGFTGVWATGSQTFSIFPGPPLPPAPGLDGSNVGIASRGFAALCSTDAETLCLGPDGRFAARVSWRRSSGEEGEGRPLTLTRDTGAFWFFGEKNLELMVKVLDGRTVNGNFWVYAAALSDVEYTLVIRDTVTGEEKTYRNPPRQLASRADVNAFAASGAPSPDAFAGFSGTGALLLGEPRRFRISATFVDPRDGQTRQATAIPLTEDTGAFWFFGPGNLELMIKVLDGRTVNGRFWIYFGALSDVSYTITVEDTETGETKTYENAPGRLVSRADVTAF